jgi:hypothetical protein
MAAAVQRSEMPQASAAVLPFMAEPLPDFAAGDGRLAARQSSFSEFSEFSDDLPGKIQSKVLGAEARVSPCDRWS